MKKLVVYFGCFLILVACEKASDRSCIKTSGGIEILVQELGSSPSLVLNDNLALLLVPDSLDYVEIKAGSNLMSFIEVGEEAGRVVFSNANKCNFLRSKDEVKLIYHYTQLDTLWLNGYGDVSGEINTDVYIYAENSFSTLNLEINNMKTELLGQVGGIEATLSGKSQSFYLYSTGAGKINAEKFIVEDTHVHSRSIADLMVTAKKRLLAELYSRGNILVYSAQEAEKTLFVEGTGSVRFID